MSDYALRYVYYQNNLHEKEDNLQHYEVDIILKKYQNHFLRKGQHMSMSKYAAAVVF